MLIQLTHVRYYVNYSDRRRAAKIIPNSMSFHQLAKLVKMGVDFYNGDGTKDRPYRDNLECIMFGYTVNDHGRIHHGIESFVTDAYCRTNIPKEFDEWFNNLKRDWQKYRLDDKKLQELENLYIDEFVRTRKRSK